MNILLFITSDIVIVITLDDMLKRLHI